MCARVCARLRACSIAYVLPLLVQKAGKCVPQPCFAQISCPSPSTLLTCQSFNSPAKGGIYLGRGPYPRYTENMTFWLRTVCTKALPAWLRLPCSLKVQKLAMKVSVALLPQRDVCSISHTGAPNQLVSCWSPCDYQKRFEPHIEQAPFWRPNVKVRRLGIHWQRPIYLRLFAFSKHSVSNVCPKSRNLPKSQSPVAGWRCPFSQQLRGSCPLASGLMPRLRRAKMEVLPNLAQRRAVPNIGMILLVSVV